jgi:multidrug efflux system membrane fusion protein
MLRTKEKSFQGSAWLLLAALCLLPSCLIWQGCASKASSPSKREEGAGRVPVTVTRVVQKDVPIDLQVAGNVEAYLTVTIKTQVGGELTRVYFREGDLVTKGDPLFEIDRRMLESQLNQYQANLSKDEAQLGLVEANLARDEAQEKYALAEVDRYSRMLKKGLVAAEQADQVQANADAVSAAVSADKAAIRSGQAAVNASKAAVENAKVLLGYTTIKSPLDGRTGNLNVQQGNVVNANATDLITINQVEPIYVAFSVPETQLSTVRRSQVVTATPRDDSAPSETGALTFIDNKVDPATGTIRLKGTFTNSDQKLWPGEFVRVTLNLATRRNALIIPGQAVQNGQDGLYVFVVKPDQTVESRPVVTGARVDQDTVIEKGLNAGEMVVTEGQLRLAPGSRVQITGSPGNSAGSNGAKRQGK